MQNVCIVDTESIYIFFFSAPSKSVQGLRVVPITTNSVKVFWTPIEQRYWSGDTETGGYRIVYQPVSDFPTVLQTPLKENVMKIKVGISF